MGNAAYCLIWTTRFKPSTAPKQTKPHAAVWWVVTTIYYGNGVKPKEASLVSAPPLTSVANLAFNTITARFISEVRCVFLRYFLVNQFTANAVYGALGDLQ